jgi:ubiquinone/menaquinone biosynthesis C-methylase UbiE
MRLGTCYRTELYKKLSLLLPKKENKVLDIGGYDGYWLNELEANRKVLVDIKPILIYENIEYLKGDALDLPFKDETFDIVYSFDVIEHIPSGNEKFFLDEIIRVTKRGGNAFVTAPSKDIRIFPKFLTNYVSKRWGHNKYNGLTVGQINKLIKNSNVDFDIIPVPARRYLTLYLVLRLIWIINKPLGKLLTKWLAMKDLKDIRREDSHGYYLLKILK